MSESLDSSSEDKALLAEFEEQQRQVDYILRQYRSVAGIFELLWQEIGIRTNKALWRLDGPNKGVGSCRNVDYELAADLISLMELRQQRDWKNYITGGVRRYCPFFRVNQGCILGNLKSPRCLDHQESEHAQEIEERFGLIIPDMRAPLQRIQQGGISPKQGDYRFRPELNDQFIAETIAEWRSRIDCIRTFPILHPEEASVINYAEILSVEPISQPVFRRFVRRT